MASRRSTSKLFGSVARDSIFRFLLAARLKAMRRLVPRMVRNRLRRYLEHRFTPGMRFVRTPAWSAAPMPSSDARLQPYLTSASAPSSLHIYGYFSRWFGLGECARMVAKVMLSRDWAVSLHDVDIDIPHSRRDHSLSGNFDRQIDSDCVLVFVNPDHWEEALLCIERAKHADRHQGRAPYVIGYWFWELEVFPEAWLVALEQVDEIMVSSAFVERAVRRVCNKPVSRIPLPIHADTASALQRHHFGLPKNDTVFFCAFDFNSSLARKNPYAVIEAFRQAFPKGDEKVFLLIKSSNGYKERALLWALMDATAFDGRIMVKDDMLEREHLQALHQCIDVHVSMHRSEGFGLGMAEAMCLGKPVIATGYSGNQDFMTASNSCLVSYQMVAVADGEYPHGLGQQWADPDPADAARWMQKLHENPGLAAQLGAQAARDIARNFSAEACMTVISKRLAAIDTERTALRSSRSRPPSIKINAPTFDAALKINEV